MDILKRIEQDHKTARKLMEQLKKEDDPHGRSALFDKLQRELWSHAKVEETVLYAAMIQAAGEKHETLEGFSEHHTINGLLDELTDMPTEGPAWGAKFDVLAELVEHHLDEEEEELFAEAREALGEERLKELGGAFDERKRHALSALEPLPERAKKKKGAA